MDHYECLKISRDAPDAVIRAAYKALMQKYHPDKYTGDPVVADQLSKQLQQAYDTLIDPQRRFDYDQRLKKAESTEHQTKSARKPNRRGHLVFRYGVFTGLALGIAYFLWTPVNTSPTKIPQPGDPRPILPGQYRTQPALPTPISSDRRPTQTRYWNQQALSVQLTNIQQSNGSCLRGTHAEYYENGDLFFSCFGHNTDGKTELDILLQTTDHHFLSAGRCENGHYRFYQQQDCQQDIFKAQKGEQTLYSDQQNASPEASVAISARLPKYWSNRQAVGQPVTVEECKRLFSQAPRYAMGPCRF